MEVTEEEVQRWWDTLTDLQRFGHVMGMIPVWANYARIFNWINNDSPFATTLVPASGKDTDCKPVKQGSTP